MLSLSPGPACHVFHSPSPLLLPLSSPSFPLVLEELDLLPKAALHLLGSLPPSCIRHLPSPPSMLKRVFPQYCACVINLSSTHFQTSQKSCSRRASTSAVTAYSWCHPSCLLTSLCPQIPLLRSPLASYSPAPRLCLQPHSLKHLPIKVLNLARLLGARTPPPYSPQN